MEINYSKKDVRKEILNLAWPSITEQLLIMMVGMVSTIFVGRIGKESMAAVGMVNMLIFVLQTVFAGLATGSTVVIARIMGEGNKEQAKLALIQSLILALISGLAITLIGYIFESQILKIFFGSAEENVLRIASHYFRIVVISLPFMVIDMVIAGSLRGAGDTKTPMYVTAVVNIINLVLSSLIIFGVSFGGRSIIPALGVTGTGIAVTVARIFGGIIRLIVLYLGKGKLSINFKYKYRIDAEMMKRIIKVGFPAFLEQAIMQGGFLIMQVLIVSIGTLETAVYQVGVNVNSLAFMPVFGFSIAATTMIGQNLGSKKYEAAEVYAKETTRMAIVVITVLATLMFIFAKPFAMLYSNDTDVINLSINIIRIFAVLEPFIAVMNVSAGVLRGAGDITYIMVTAIVGLWTFRVGLAYILHWTTHLGMYAVMLGICADFGARSIMYVIRIRKGSWKYLKI